MDSGEITRLTEAACDGDRKALEGLLQHYLPELRAFVRLRAGPLVRARESQSDLVQSVCREVLQNAARFQHPSASAFKRWLYTSALRKIVDRRNYLRADRRDVLREVDIERSPRDVESGAEAGLLTFYKTFTTPSQNVSLKEEVERIEAAFETLEDDHREVITLAHVMGLPRVEIAAQMGRSEAAVRQLLHRALAQVARRLRTEASDDS